MITYVSHQCKDEMRGISDLDFRLFLRSFEGFV